ncbi:MAG: hypothetical protein H0U77_13270 [Nocardioidaceae bacterium]|nr:hypothetical protein [Nocardioidaceae bacterium]
MSARRVFLHIGLHKTGTTFLQSVLQANRHRLAEQGVLFPGGDAGLVQKFAVWDLVGRRPRGVRDHRIAGQWNALSQAVRGDARDTALISVEYLSLVTPAQARRAIHSFAGAQVHVVATVRDLGRVLMSAWQEELKNDNTWTWEEFATAVRDPGQRASNPARGFWQQQDIPAVLETWRAALPADRVHVVVVPPSGDSPQPLLTRFCGVVGIDPEQLVDDVTWTNESIGVAGAEVLRRVNARLDHRLHQRQYDKVVKRTMSPAFRGDEAQRLVLPAAEVDWVQAEARRMVAAVESGGYDVVGDLGDLVPRADAHGRHPGEASSDELLEASLSALARLAEEHAAVWWQTRGAESGVAAAGASSRLGSSARRAAFASRRRGAALADRNRVAAGAMRVYLRLQARARRRALS